MTYAELDDAVGRNAAALLRAGLGRATAWRAGWARRCSPASFRSPRRGQGWSMCRSTRCCGARRSRISSPTAGRRLLIANAARLDSLEAGDLGEAKAVPLEAWLAPGPGAAALDPRSRRRLPALLYTSGSTGRPKGVMLSHANLWLGAISVAHYLGLSARRAHVVRAAAGVRLWAEPIAVDLGGGRLRDRVRLSPAARRGARRCGVMTSRCWPACRPCGCSWPSRSGARRGQPAHADQQRRPFARAGGAPPARAVPAARGCT